MSSQFIKSFFPALVAISGRISMFRDDLIPRTEIDVLIEMMQCSKQPHCPKPPIRTNTPHNSVGGGLDNLNEIAYEKEQQWRDALLQTERERQMYDHWRKAAKRAQEEWSTAQKQADEAMKIQQTRLRQWEKAMNGAVRSLECAKMQEAAASRQLETARYTLVNAENMVQSLYTKRPSTPMPCQDKPKMNPPVLPCPPPPMCPPMSFCPPPLICPPMSCPPKPSCTVMLPPPGLPTCPRRAQCNSAPVCPPKTSCHRQPGSPRFPVVVASKSPMPKCPPMEMCPPMANCPRKRPCLRPNGPSRPFSPSNGPPRSCLPANGPTRQFAPSNGPTRQCGPSNGAVRGPVMKSFVPGKGRGPVLPMVKSEL